MSKGEKTWIDLSPLCVKSDLSSRESPLLDKPTKKPEDIKDHKLRQSAPGIYLDLGATQHGKHLMTTPQSQLTDQQRSYFKDQDRLTTMLKYGTRLGLVL